MMSRRSIFVFLFVLTTSIVSACDSSPTGPASNLPATVQLQVGESVVLASGGLSVSYLETTQDSRCPVTVECVWEGEGVVRISLSDDGGVLGSPSLSTNLHGSSPNAVRLDRYLLTVVDLDPYPETPGGIPPSDYRLTLRID